MDSFLASSIHVIIVVFIVSVLCSGLFHDEVSIPCAPVAVRNSFATRERSNKPLHQKSEKIYILHSCSKLGMNLILWMHEPWMTRFLFKLDFFNPFRCHVPPKHKPHLINIFGEYGCNVCSGWKAIASIHIYAQERRYEIDSIVVWCFNHPSEPGHHENSI